MESCSVVVRYSGRTFGAKRTPSGKIIVTAHDGRHVDIKDDEISAYLWLGNHGLRRGKIKKLLDAVMRNEGPFADPNHPQRVKI